MNFSEQDAVALIGAQTVELFCLRREVERLRSELAKLQPKTENVVKLPEAQNGTG